MFRCCHQCDSSHVLVTGGGGGLRLGTISAGKIQQGENFDTPPILVQGHLTWETSTPPTLDPLWKVSCVKLWPVKFTLYLLGPLLTNCLKILYQGSIFIVPQSGWTIKMHKEQEEPQLAQNISWEKFRHQTEKRKFPHELVP